MSTLVLDCDGVVLDANPAKTNAFRLAALPYGEAAANALAEHNIRMGGVSRYAKFRHFLENIVGGEHTEDEYRALLAAYAREAKAGLMAAAASPGLAGLRAATPGARWMMVSGGDQAELREVLAARGLDSLFDAGIFGCPDPKPAIIARELAAGRITLPALCVGDTRHDHEAAAASGIPFVFAHAWTEFAGWREYCAAHGIPAVPGLAELAADRRLLESLLGPNISISKHIP